MRKACIELMGGTKIACLVAGDLGTGRCLFIREVSKDIFDEPTQEQWLEAFKCCQAKAEELKYEVTRIRGARLAGL